MNDIDKKVEIHSDKKDWLKTLHTRTWEMELLIVGFTLLILWKLPDNFIRWRAMIIANSSEVLSLEIWIFTSMVLIGIRIMMINLIVHLLFRGYWVGIIGINSIFPAGIDYQQLPFHSIFSDYLKHKLQNLDQLSITIDRICSAIFGFSFLLVFVFITFGCYLGGFMVIALVINWMHDYLSPSFESIFSSGMLIFIVIPYLLGGLLGLIDFFSLGALKKNKRNWFAKPYFYSSRFFGLITLSFLFQPIYYTLISNVSRKLIGTILSIYIITIIGFISVNYNNYIFYPDEVPNSETILYKEHYENFITESIQKIDFIDCPTIQADIITEPFIRLYIPYQVSDNDSLTSHCPEIQPFRHAGISSNFKLVPVDGTYVIVYGSEKAITDSTYQNVLACLASFYTITIDGIEQTDLNFFFYRHPHKGEPGIMTYLPTSHLRSGYHVLNVRKNVNYQSVEELRYEMQIIPFYLE